MNIIAIDKSLIPYEFDIVLNGRNYTFKINYNKTGDFFTVDLSGTEPLVTGEIIRLGRFLFLDYLQDKDNNKDERFPDDLILPVDITGNETRVGFDQLSESVFLFVNTRASLGVL